MDEKRWRENGRPNYRVGKGFGQWWWKKVEPNEENTVVIQSPLCGGLIKILMSVMF